MNVGSRLNLDRIGAIASTVCAVHCLLTGVAFGLLSVFGLGFIGSPQAEFGFIAFAVIVGSFALYHGHRKHHSLVPGMIFAFGIGCMLVSHLVFRHDHAHDHPELAFDAAHLPSTLLNVLAGLSLVAFHVVNNRMQHSCGSVHCNHKSG